MGVDSRIILTITTYLRLVFPDTHFLRWEFPYTGGKLDNAFETNKKPFCLRIDIGRGNEGQFTVIESTIMVTEDKANTSIQILSIYKDDHRTEGLCLSFAKERD